ncbi:MAG: hypothetical protein IJI44_04005 [Erysipelotrichaceae bacterium]|nr:hypothetical protein [Erysipelotrichaceae bacterium]
MKYSKLIEFYQYIEGHLKYICGHLLADEEKDWYERLGELGSDSFGMLIKRVQKLQNDKQIIFFDEKELEDLNALRISRNYWVHQCFGGTDMTMIPVMFQNSELRRSEHGTRLIADLSAAVKWDEKLAEKMRGKQ